jgi:hypothetical protein
MKTIFYFLHFLAIVHKLLRQIHLWTGMVVAACNLSTGEAEEASGVKGQPRISSKTVPSHGTQAKINKQPGFFYQAIRA